MQTSVIGYPRIGASRELKFVLEDYFKGQVSLELLQHTASTLRQQHWTIQQKQQIDYISSGDFSFYDGVLDTALLFNIVPKRYIQLALNELDTYFAMARGYQGQHGDVKALAMKKWFNTNYHYLVPEIEQDTTIKLAGSKLFNEYNEAKALGIETKPTLVGAFTLLKLAKYTGTKTAEYFIESTIAAYQDVIRKLESLGAKWIQFDEPYLVTDLSHEDLDLFTTLYQGILSAKDTSKVLCQTYFGDIRDSFNIVQTLPFDGIGLDFVEGVESLALVEQSNWSETQLLFAGVINGKNIWKNNYEKTIALVNQIKKIVPHVVIGTSCSLLHVPYSVKQETKLEQSVINHLAFAEEKLEELAQLKQILSFANPAEHPLYIANQQVSILERFAKQEQLAATIAKLSEDEFTRHPHFKERAQIQKERLNLEKLPTTTIGSFPQTADVRAKRSAYKKGKLSEEQYKQFNFEKIKECIKKQEEIGLDVLVHGEFERNDMVEYFGEALDGFIFTQFAWVQSYGTRCVKPPIIWGDITRSKPITVEYSVYANSLTAKHVKGMLTGPVTILNWSFPREDIGLKEMAYQIALAIRDEVLDLEANGIQIIQIDEAALREKLPLRKSDWRSQYLDWAIPAFRLTHSKVQADTQVHTHMCYSQFSDIIKDIDAMDADVITFEASRSDLSLIDTLHAVSFQTEVGPGVYDIHSPRIPSVDELEQAIKRIYDKVDVSKLWINPDCGLKTRGEHETWASLANLVEATKRFRKKLALSH